MTILLHALLGARRARQVVLISLALALVTMLVVFGGLFSIAHQIKSGFSDATHARASVPSTGSATTTAPVKTVYHAAHGDRVLTGPGFVTQYPSGWRRWIKHTRVNGKPAWAAVFSSTHRVVGSTPRPVRGQEVMMVIEYPMSAKLKQDPDANSQTATEFLLYSIGLPKGAKQLGRVSPDAPSTLGGVSAATLAVSYVEQGQGVVQIDSVARHDGKAYVLASYSQASVDRVADAALGQVIAGWQWR
jgi:hypothetical protein